MKISERVLETVEEFGPVTSSQITELLADHVNTDHQVHCAVSNLKKKGEIVAVENPGGRGDKYVISGAEDAVESEPEPSDVRAANGKNAAGSGVVSKKPPESTRTPPPPPGQKPEQEDPPEPTEAEWQIGLGVGDGFYILRHLRTVLMDRAPAYVDAFELGDYEPLNQYDAPLIGIVLHNLVEQGVVAAINTNSGAAYAWVGFGQPRMQSHTRVYRYLRASFDFAQQQLDECVNELLSDPELTELLSPLRQQRNQALDHLMGRDQ